MNTFRRAFNAFKREGVWVGYRVLMRVGRWLLPIKLRHRARAEPLYGEKIAERFGVYNGSLASTSSLVPHPAPSTLVWIHAVSLGETRLAATLIDALREAVREEAKNSKAPAQPLHFLLTHGTATGRAAGAALLHSGDIQVWQPWDDSASVQAFYDYFRPKVGLLIETELWPNLVLQGAARGVPLYVANARMSARTFAKTRQLEHFARSVYTAMSGFFAQTQEDAQRIRYFAEAAPDAAKCPHIAVTGSMKFDARPAPELLALGRRWRSTIAKPTVLFASSREGEEALFLRAISDLPSKQRQAVHWLLVPRHPQRFEAVAGLIEQAGYAVSRRSAWTASPKDADGDPPFDSQAVLPPADNGEADTVLLGDSLGEMPAYYAAAYVALLGGSFEPLGGQNLIEAAACGCPVVMGPHTFNFAQAALDAQAVGAAQQVADMSAALHQALATALAASEQIEAQRQSCLNFAASQRGATRAVVADLQTLLAR